MKRGKLAAPEDIIAEPMLRDRSELASLYPTPKPINASPISTPAEISARQRKAHEQQAKALRREIIRTGFYITLPYIVGLLTAQLVIAQVPNIQQNDIGGAMFVVFTSFLLSAATVFIAYVSWRRTDQIFADHYLKSWPFTLAVLLSVASATPLAFRLVGLVTGEWYGYLASLVLIMVVGWGVSAALIFLWTSQWPVKIKLAGLILIPILFGLLWLV